LKFPVLHPAIFIKRNNRFTAEVRLAMGDLTTAHVPTTGRLTGALRPGCRTWLEPARNPGRKTAFTLVLSELQNGGLCSINAMMANRLFNEAFLKGKLEAFSYERIEKEVTFDHSRLDFRLSDGKATCWVEVKSVTFATNRVGMFPDAPTSRGRKHLGELAKLVSLGQAASVVFIAQREDAERFAPFTAIDPDFAAALRRVHQEGVEVHAYRCDVTTERIKIAEEIPVDLI
jgi:sugar fermentation stimulation protein A